MSLTHYFRPMKSVAEIFAKTGATFGDFEVRGTDEDDVVSQRARLRATEYARVAVAGKGIAVIKCHHRCLREIYCEIAGYGYWDDGLRPAGEVELKLPPLFDDSGSATKLRFQPLETFRAHCCLDAAQRNP